MVDAPGAPVVVTLPGEIDYTNAAGIQADLHAAIVRGGVVIADLSRTTFCDSRGFSTLVKAHQRAQETRAEFRVVVPPGPVRRNMAALALDRALAVFPGMDLALAGHI